MNYNQLNHLHALSRLLDQADKLNTLADQINLDGSTGPQVGQSPPSPARSTGGAAPHRRPK
jgi:hypothetical protein